jgi:O-methyltransferase
VPSMRSWIRRFVQSIRRRVGSSPVPRDASQRLYPDLDDATWSIIERVKAYSMAGAERLYSLCTSIRYIVDSEIPGAVVECGVWRGGCMMAAALTLLERRATDRDLYLYDTFEGMTAPTNMDQDFRGDAAEEIIARQHHGDASRWCRAGVDEVIENMRATGYPMERVHFVKGRVEDTLPIDPPRAIALLRLDTDWYESTRYELTHLYPRLSFGGVLIVDDYGYWRGARIAVDEYLREHNLRLLLQRVDYTCRLAVKLDETR